MKMALNSALQRASQLPATKQGSALTCSPPPRAPRSPSRHFFQHRAGLPPQQQRKTLCAASESGEGVQQKQEAEEVPPQQQAMLQRALADLQEHIETPKGQEHKDGRKVVQWFAEKLKGPRDLELERVVKSVMAGGSADNLLRVLVTMEHTEERKKGILGPEPAGPAEVLKEDPERKKREAQLVDLFSKLDTRKTGYLTLTAFFNGLELLREYMSDEELELVGSSMDGQGRVGLEQFLAVVASADENHASKDAAFLHHLTHKNPSDSIVDKFI